MPTTLPKAQRKLLEKVTQDARDVAERAARAALENLAVHEKDYRAHMTVEQRELRNRLRARGRALGDPRDVRQGTQAIGHLGEGIAYEQWHRLLFTRFLTENHLLHTDEENGAVPVTLEECDELAPGMGTRDGFDLACRFASRILPGVFRRNDPVLDLRLAPNDEVELRKLLHSLPSEVFTADDSLGWTYQFWQAKRKDQVNASGKKIGADELAPVTQLFTEDYIVEFLLHNTLGTWWAGKIGPIQAASEDEARSRAALPARDGGPEVAWAYLRFVQDEGSKTWSPAAGTFSGWPTAARLIRLLDPCMGSGHFLVFALPILVALRMQEENLSAAQSVVAVLQDNLHGLELDERCTQIAAFNVALAAWKLAGYQALPLLHLACSGLAPNATEAEWGALVAAGENSNRLCRGMMRLHGLFKDAPILGSLINPRAIAGNLIEAEFQELAPLLAAALATIENQQSRLEIDAVELTVIAQGLAKAGELLAGQFTIVLTNVPYLGRGNQDELLKAHLDLAYQKSKWDLATGFVERCKAFCEPLGSFGLVTPQQWCFGDKFIEFRKDIIQCLNWNIVARLGTNAFTMISGEVVNVVLISATLSIPQSGDTTAAIDVSSAESAEAKAISLRTLPLQTFSQLNQLKNPDFRVTLNNPGTRSLLGTVAKSTEGLSSGDGDRFISKFWETFVDGKRWAFLQSAPEIRNPYCGLTDIVLWEDGKGEMSGSAAARIRGHSAWGKSGIVIAKMNSKRVSLYLGGLFAKNCAVLSAASTRDDAALFEFTENPNFEVEVQRLDANMNTATSVFEKLPFDLTHWQQVAAEKYPNGLPKPFSSDPTQWLFNGRPKGSDQPLHVALARLLGYLWPRQTGNSFPDCPPLDPGGLESLANEEGIVCLPPINREQPAAARLRQFLTTALGTFDERAVIAAAGLKGSKSETLDEWLRDECFEQHAKLFHDRPFLWHIWDGRPDGFHAFVNYHRLDYAMLQNLTYSYLGDWIHQQEDDAKGDKPGAAGRLGAARALQNELAKILEGEPPYDIFVRWKALSQQALGWHPDLNDGVRLNIRPFMQANDVGQRGAGILRTKPNIKWEKDRGKEPARDKADFPWFWHETEPALDPAGGPDFIGHRWNSVHLSLDQKRQARAKAATEPAHRLPTQSHG